MVRREKGSRVTPKKQATGSAVSTPPAHSGRYTPPIPKEFKQSAPWVPWVMFGLLISGMLVIVGNYLLDAADIGLKSSNAYLFLGLGLITGGFITATKYH